MLGTATLLGLASTTAHAQRLTDVQSGTMVRVETCAHDVFSGPLLNADADSVRIRTVGQQPPVALANTRVCGYAIGAGKDRARGAWEGAKIGGGFGLVLWALTKALSSGDANNAPTLGRNIGLLSFALGIGIGTVAAPERWIPPRQ
jgi:hypothetical protein